MLMQHPMEMPVIGGAVSSILPKVNLAPDQAIEQARQAILLTGRLSWTMPLALGLWMNNRYSDALEVLQRTGVDDAAATWPIFIFCWAWCLVRSPVMINWLVRLMNVLLILIPIVPDAFYNLANLIR